MIKAMTIGLLLKATDQASGPVRGLSRAVAGIETGIERMSAASDNAAKKLSKLVAKGKELGEIGKKVAMTGAGVTATGGVAAYKLGLGDVVDQGMEAEHALRSMGNVAELTNGQLAKINSGLLITSGKVNQTQKELVEGMTILVAKGLDPRIAQNFMPVIGKTATAATAAIADISTTTFAAYDNLKVPIKDLAKSMDILSQSGQMGSFELKNMATYFPMVTAGAAALGAKGVPAVAQIGAALQIAMKGAADPSMAANNFQNFLQKITSKETVKNFANFGINVESELNTALKKGLDPFEHMVNLTRKATGGNKFKLSEIFGDMQVTNFLNPMMQNMDEYRRIRDKSLEATGVVDKNFAAMMGTTKEETKNLKVNLAALALPALNGPLRLANALLKTINGNAFLLKLTLFAVTSLVVGGLGLTALGGAMMAWPKLLTGAKVAAAGLRLTLVGLRVASIALGGPWVWGTLLLIAAAAAVWKYWGAIKSFLTGLKPLLGSFFAAGANIATSIGKGILSAAAHPVHAIKGIVQKIRNHLPFSPAKEGPLKDLHKVKLIETIAGGMNPAPLVKAMRRATATALMAATPALAAGGQGGGVMQITFAPQITVQGGSPGEVQGAVGRALDVSFAEFERFMQRYQAQKERRSF